MSAAQHPSPTTRPAREPERDGRPGHVPREHGNSPAAWTAVTIMVIGALVCAIAFPLTSPVTFAVGLVVVVLGLAIGKVMSMAGYGSLPTYEVQEPNPTSLEGPTLTEPPPRS